MHDTHTSVIPIGDWINILSASTRFACDRIRDRAIREIGAMDPATLHPVETILLAEQFSVPEWLIPSYAVLCKRPQPLDMVEAQKLGLVTTVLIAQAREKVREMGSIRAGTGPVPAQNAESVVRTVFNLPLSRPSLQSVS